MGNKNGLFRGWFRTKGEIISDEIYEETENFKGCIHLSDCSHGQIVSLHGRVDSIVYTPVTDRNRARKFIVTLDEGRGKVEIIFLGRAKIPGIDPGVGLTVHGRILLNERKPTIYNPRYEISPVAHVG